MRGRLPKPNATRVAEGMRGHRPLTNEPRHAAGIPEKPKTISAEASRVWEELLGNMDPRILAQTDRRALWQLAEDEAILQAAYTGFWKMAKKLKTEAKSKGRDLPAGEIMSLLQMSNGRQAMLAIRDLAARVIIERREFGLTPSARARINVPGEQTMDDPIDDAIFSGRTEMFVLPRPN